MQRSLFLTALAVAHVLLHGLVHGWWTDRWSVSGEPQASADRLANVPLTVGEWDGDAMELDAKHQAIGEIRGYVLRRYVHRRHKTAVSLLIVCGRPGPISVHTPDVCYRGAGFEAVAPAQRQCLACGSGAAPAEFWVGAFRRREEEAAQLHIFWAWNDRKGGQAPDHPRFAFGGAPALYKLYVVRETSPAEGPPDADPGAEFLRALLPMLDETLFTRRQ